MKGEQLFHAFSDIDSQYIEDSVHYPKIARRNMLRGILSCCITISIIFLIFALFQPNADHGICIYRIGDNYYLSNYQTIFKPYVQHINSDSSDTDLAYGIVFDSVEEMYRDFKNLNFTEDEIFNIQQLLKRNHGKIKIPNPKQLCTPQFPMGVSWSGKVSWYGTEAYKFSTSYIYAKRCIISTCSEETYRIRTKQLLEYAGDDILEVIRTEKLEDRGATMYYTQSRKNSNQGKFMVYTLTQANKTIVVEEHFLHIEDHKSSYIRLFIQQGNCYGTVYLDSYGVRPTVEELLGFGFEPFMS